MKAKGRVHLGKGSRQTRMETEFRGQSRRQRPVTEVTLTSFWSSFTEASRQGAQCPEQP